MTLHKYISDRASIEAEIRHPLAKDRSPDYDDTISRGMTVMSQEAFKEGALSLLPFIEEISVKFAEWGLLNAERKGRNSWMMFDNKKIEMINYTTKELFSLFIEEYLKQVNK